MALPCLTVTFLLYMQCSLGCHGNGVYHFSMHESCGCFPETHRLPGLHRTCGRHSLVVSRHPTDCLSHSHTLTRHAWYSHECSMRVCLASGSRTSLRCTLSCMLHVANHSVRASANFAAVRASTMYHVDWAKIKSMALSILQFLTVVTKYNSCSVR